MRHKIWLQFLSQSQSVCLDCHFRSAVAFQFASGSSRCFNILLLLHHIPPPWPPCLWLIAEGAEKRKEEGGSLVLWYTSCLPKSTFKPLQCGPHYSIYASSSSFFFFFSSTAVTHKPTIFYSLKDPELRGTSTAASFCVSIVFDTFQMYVIQKVIAGCYFSVLFGSRVKSVVEEPELMMVLILHQVYSESRSLTESAANHLVLRSPHIFQFAPLLQL